MNDFDYDALQKKRIASGAYHRKNGSKSHACSLPSDRLTEAQRRKLDGPVTTLKLNEPMTWADFLALSEEHKRLYLSHLMDRYRPSCRALGEMLGVSAITACRALQSCGASRGRETRATAEQRAAWAEFLGKAAPAEEEQDDTPPAPEDPPTERAKTDSTAVVTRFDITYAHVGNWDELYVLLCETTALVGDRTVRVIVE